jgi:CheY-like chemotaxis protein
MAQVLKILLVEDNPADAELARENLDSCKILHELDVAADGVEALAYLRRQAPYSDKIAPDLILLDLNLPRLDGRELLAAIKQDPELRRIPVVVLTSSTTERDILMSYDLHASAYVVKPVDLNGFGEIVRAIEGFWFSVVRYPPKP